MAVALLATVSTLHMAPCNVDASKLPNFDALVSYSCEMLLTMALEPMLIPFTLVTYDCNYIS